MLQNILNSFQVSSKEKSGGGPDQPTFSDNSFSISSTISSTTFDASTGTSTTNHSEDPPSTSTTSDNLPEHSDDSLTSVVWPTFLNFPTEFKDGTWKCPFCSDSAYRIKQHLTKHKDNIRDWRAAESFCEAMAVMKRNQSKRKADKKREPLRSQKPERKKVLKKADQKRKEKPERK